MLFIVNIANSGCFRLWMPQAVDLKKAKNNANCAFAGRYPLTAAQQNSILQKGLGNIKFPMIMWLGYMTGLEQKS